MSAAAGAGSAVRLHSVGDAVGDMMSVTMPVTLTLDDSE